MLNPYRVSPIATTAANAPRVGGAAGRINSRERIKARSSATPDSLRRRTLVVGIVLALWMVCIGARLGYLQIKRHEFFRLQAASQQQNSSPLRGVRGLILDCNGRELARSVTVASVFVEPPKIENINYAAQMLAPILNESPAGLAARLQKAKTDGRKFIWLKRKLDKAIGDKIVNLKIGGVGVQDELKRFYPNGNLASHVLGFVGLDNNGLGGIEQTQNVKLAGERGRVFFERDNKHHAYESSEVAARHGGSIVLTIDSVIQYQTEQILNAAVANSNARAGTAIILNPKNGEILALANAPSFDPNLALSDKDVDAKNGKADHEKTRLYRTQLRRNEALQNIYEPGSTFKIVTYAAAIEEGLARPDEKIDCQNGAITIAGRTIHDHHAYGSLSVTDALAKSSNVAAIKLGLRLGDNRFYDYARRFGFGARTGVDLPGETAGLLRPVSRWQKSSIGSIAIGQEIGTTPLQIVSAFATLANDGTRIAPHIVRGVQAPDGKIIAGNSSASTQVVTPKTARALRAMLESVTLRGTAKKAQLDGYTAAGKTGTAQKIDAHTKTYSATKYVASFAGFAPIENPRVAIIVVLDEPQGAYHGGDAAAPVFRDIASLVLPYMNVMPDTDFDEEPDAGADTQFASQNGNGKIDLRDASNTRLAIWQANEDFARERDEQIQVEHGGQVIYTSAAARGLQMPNLKGTSVRDAWTLCSQLGLKLEAHGTGQAREQHPSPGAIVDAGETVRVVFAN